MTYSCLLGLGLGVYKYGHPKLELLTVSFKSDLSLLFYQSWETKICISIQKYSVCGSIYEYCTVKRNKPDFKCSPELVCVCGLYGSKADCTVSLLQEGMTCDTSQCCDAVLQGVGLVVNLKCRLRHPTTSTGVKGGVPGPSWPSLSVYPVTSCQQLANHSKEES